MLAKHASQAEWLNLSQGMASYLSRMEEVSRQIGLLSGRFEFAEGWRRHLDVGYAPEDADPTAKLLGERVLRNPRLN
jgi:N-acetylglucosamine malate deacetylase 1